MLNYKNPFPVRLHNLLWEFRLGISTNGLVEIPYHDAYHYAAVRYLTINRILRFLDLGRSDLFVDIGSGKGRVVCSAARFDLQAVLGVEWSSELCKAAEANIARMRGRKSPIKVINSTAQEFNYSEGTVFTLFNPFGAVTLNAVLHSIELSLKAHPPAIRIVYVNPMHDEVFAQMKWLERYEFWNANNKKMEHAVSYYRTQPGV